MASRSILGYEGFNNYHKCISTLSIPLQVFMEIMCGVFCRLYVYLWSLDIEFKCRALVWSFSF